MLLRETANQRGGGDWSRTEFVPCPGGDPASGPLDLLSLGKAVLAEADIIKT